MVCVRRMKTQEASANRRSRHRPLRFASTEEAVIYLELMGFTVEDGRISFNRLAMATHRTLFAIDWLCGNGFTYAARTASQAPSKEAEHVANGLLSCRALAGELSAARRTIAGKAVTLRDDRHLKS
jgi:hypothetical protein